MQEPYLRLRFLNLAVVEYMIPPNPNSIIKATVVLFLVDKTIRNCIGLANSFFRLYFTNNY